VRRDFEAVTQNVEQRFDAVRQCAAAGYPTRVMQMLLNACAVCRCATCYRSAIPLCASWPGGLPADVPLAPRSPHRRPVVDGVQVCLRRIVPANGWIGASAGDRT
jgi:hypothetical protein